VATITIDDVRANMWPDGATRISDTTFASDNGAAANALNFFFFGDVEDSTAYAWLGGGPIMCADEGEDLLGPVDFQQVVAHEAGHALCLRHVCPSDEEEEGGQTGFLGHECDDPDERFLMYPYWNVSDSMNFATNGAGVREIDRARGAATFFEQGKTEQLAILPTCSTAAPDANF
jgi:hypothetical protein